MKLFGSRWFGRGDCESNDRDRLALGRMHMELLRQSESRNFNDYEVKVFSQWGEDGLIEYLVSRVPIKNATFVEFGVEDYSESNTRFLLMNRNWKGFVIDGSSCHTKRIQSSSYFWKYALQVKNAFITAENINALIEGAGFGSDVGLLSIDIDGNDYWVWKAISCISPQIVVCEYNSIFGMNRKLSTPYSPHFRRSQYHHTNLVYGASISALIELGLDKGYECVGGNRAGNNVFFVRRDCLSGLRPVVAAEAYRESHFREGRDLKGRLGFWDFGGRLKAVGDARVVNLESGALVSLNEAC